MEEDFKLAVELLILVIIAIMATIIMGTLYRAGIVSSTYSITISVIVALASLLVAVYLAQKYSEATIWF